MVTWAAPPPGTSAAMFGMSVTAVAPEPTTTTRLPAFGVV
jgi:hypothetical protein